MFLARLAPSSRRVMRGALDAMAAQLTGDALDALSCPWERLRYQHAVALRTKLVERYAPATANQHLSALRGVLREAWRLELIPADVYQKAIDLDPVKGHRLPAGRELAPTELRDLFAQVAADPTPLGARDAAMLSLLYGGGLRRAEVVGLDLADYDAATGAIRVRKGKGNKERMVYATNGARDAIEAWIELRGTDAGALLCAVTKGSKIRLRRLTAQTVYDALKRRAEQAGVADFSPHDCRRTFVSNLLDRGADLATVQQLAGHANVNTTARYDRRGEVAKKRAAELLHVPYRRS